MNVLTVAEVAARLRVSENTVYRLVARGDLRKLVCGPKLIRIPESEIERLAEVNNAAT